MIGNTYAAFGGVRAELGGRALRWLELIREIQKIGIIGGGLIGAGWAALFAARGGHEVSVWDPSDCVRATLHEKLGLAREQLARLGNDASGSVSFAEVMEGALVDADWLQEMRPKRLV